VNKLRARRIATFSSSAAFSALAMLAACGEESRSTFETPAPDAAALDGSGAGDGAGFADTGGGDPFEGCATAQAEAERRPVYMLFVLDGSGSMATKPDGSPSNKWAAAHDALGAIFDDLGAKKDSAVGVGLTIFCDTADTTCKDVVGTPNASTAGPYDQMNVPVGFVDATQLGYLHARLDPATPNLGTPTYEVLSGQLPVLSAFTPTGQLRPGGKKVLVFISDGVPDEEMPEGRRDPNDTDGEAKASRDTVLGEASKPDGVTTFSVGVGELVPINAGYYDPKFMASLAVAGKTANSGCDPNEVIDEKKMCHFQITPGAKTVQQLRQDFIDAINAIRTKSLSCEFPLVKPDGGASVDPSKVNVVFDGTGGKSVLSQDGQDGWTYDDPANPTKVVLHGPTCDRVKADPAGKVSIVLGCKTILK
jgi:hypothetical protein